MLLESVSLPNISDAPAIAQNIVAALEDAIILGDLPPGLHLTETMLCERTGASRSPIREALQVMERDGLVTRTRHKGVRVAPLTIDHLDQLYACRIPLETTAARLAAEKATKSEIEDIRLSHIDCKQRCEKNDVLGHFRANVRMSQRIFVAAHNVPLSRLLESIHKQALRYRYISYQRSQTHRKGSVKRNAEVVAALESRDGHRAAELVREGIEVAHKFIRKCLAERPTKK